MHLKEHSIEAERFVKSPSDLLDYPDNLNESLAPRSANNAGFASSTGNKRSITEPPIARIERD